MSTVAHIMNSNNIPPRSQISTSKKWISVGSEKWAQIKNISSVEIIEENEGIYHLYLYMNDGKYYRIILTTQEEVNAMAEKIMNI